MKISVVVPLYNKEKSVLRAINSVLNQTEQDFELIVVNDGSTDNSAAWVAGSCDGRKVRLVDQENAGVSAARNRGVAEAHSDLIAFLDADDEWDPEFLKTILDLRSEFPEARVFGTSYSFQHQDGTLSQPKTAHLFETGYRGMLDNFLEIIRIGLPFNSSAFAVIKSAYEDVGGFPVGIRFGEDVDCWIRLSLKYQFAYMNSSLAIYHQDAENRACEIYYPSYEEYYPVKKLVQMLTDGKVQSYFRQSAIEYIAKHQLALANSRLYYSNPTQARILIKTCSGTKIYAGKWIVLYLSTFLPPVILQLLIKFKHMIKS